MLQTIKVFQHSDDLKTGDDTFTKVKSFIYNMFGVCLKMNVCYIFRLFAYTTLKKLLIPKLWPLKVQIVITLTIFFFNLKNELIILFIMLNNLSQEVTRKKPQEKLWEL